MASTNFLAFLVFSLALVFVASVPSHRQKRQFFEPDNNFVEEPLGLSSGALDVLGQVSSGFSCEGQIYGYYADMDTDCRVFHVCYPVEYPDGRAETLQWSFFCGNQTVFDQSVLACVHLEDAIPCSDTPSFFFRNEEFGIIPDNNF